MTTLSEQSETTQPKQPPKRQISFAATFALSGLASITAESCTYPLDVKIIHFCSE